MAFCNPAQIKRAGPLAELDSLRRTHHRAACRSPSATCPPARRLLLRAAASPAFDPESLTDRDVPLSRLQQQLDAAVEGEDYAAAAQLRDEIERRRFDSRLAVEEANDRFYAAFMSGRLADMEAAWGTGDQVQCIHPLSACIAGREQVLASWKSVFGGGRLRIALEDVRICAGESEAFVTCVEVVDASEEEGRVAATNVFEKQQGAWKMVLHHASPLPRPLKFS